MEKKYSESLDEKDIEYPEFPLEVSTKCMSVKSGPFDKRMRHFDIVTDEEKDYLQTREGRIRNYYPFVRPQMTTQGSTKYPHLFLKATYPRGSSDRMDEIVFANDGSEDTMINERYTLIAKRYFDGKDSDIIPPFKVEYSRLQKTFPIMSIGSKNVKKLIEDIIEDMMSQNKKIEVKEDDRHYPETDSPKLSEILDRRIESLKKI